MGSPDFEMTIRAPSERDIYSKGGFVAKVGEADE
jgi:hypothetical protein